MTELLIVLGMLVFTIGDVIGYIQCRRRGMPRNPYIPYVWLVWLIRMRKNKV
jgi:hypothetical protein